MNNNCIFCKIINKKIESKIIFENNLIIVILDAYPIENGHCLILPKKHKKNIIELDEDELKEIAIIQKKIIKLIQKKMKPKGFNVLNNFNKISGQVIDHYHLHIIPKYNEEEGFYFSNKKISNSIKISKILEILKK